jgi:hypothetical protein
LTTAGTLTTKVKGTFALAVPDMANYELKTIKGEHEGSNTALLHLQYDNSNLIEISRYADTTEAMTSLIENTQLNGNLIVQGLATGTDPALHVEKDVVIDGTLTVDGQLITSMTITHKTDLEDEDAGYFCEMNGEIYTGYEKVGVTDCICQVKKAMALNRKIVGIMTGRGSFASHGDVLVKVVAGDYQLGDVLIPGGENGARVANDTEKLFVVMNGLPRVRISSLKSGLNGMVACFLS